LVKTGEHKRMISKESKTEMARISSELVSYIRYIQKRYKEEYEANIDFTEASLILSKRAKDFTLFK